MKQPQTCSFCATSTKTTTCPTCHAQFGFKDGKGDIRSRTGFLTIGALSAVFAALCFTLAAKIPLWYYFYPLMGFGICLASGALIVAVQLMIGPKWWPNRNIKS